MVKNLLKLNPNLSSLFDFLDYTLKYIEKQDRLSRVVMAERHIWKTKKNN